MTADEMLVAPDQLASAPGLSQVERVVDTFIAPSKTFRDILRSTSWWLPFVLLVLSTMATAFVVQKQVGFDRVYENQMRLSPKTAERMDSLTPEQKSAAATRTAATYKYTSYGSSLFILIFLAIDALALWAAFNFGLGAKTTFGQVFAVTIYSALPYLLLSLLTIVTLYFGGSAESYDMKNPVGTNIAYYMPEAAGWLKGFLGSFDVIKLWSVVLQVIGMAIIAKKTIMQSAVIVGIFWVIGVVFGMVGGAFS